MNRARKTGHSHTVSLDECSREKLEHLLRKGNYRIDRVEHARVAARKENCRIVLYNSGKCVVQGKGADDWIRFVLEPQVLGRARLDYAAVHDPSIVEPHIGVDESGKGDFFGPLVIAAAYTDGDTAQSLLNQGVRDSKSLSDNRIHELAPRLRRELGGRFALVTIGPRSYNRLYAQMRNVNRLLAWGHARAIEDLLEKVPGCPRVLSDQFGPVRRIEQALLRRGREIRLEQRPRAESDPAVAAASILARAAFLDGLEKLRSIHPEPFPKGASRAVRERAARLVRDKGPEALEQVAKCHFRTADQVLRECGCRPETDEEQE